MRIGRLALAALLASSTMVVGQVVAPATAAGPAEKCVDAVDLALQNDFGFTQIGSTLQPAVCKGAQQRAYLQLDMTMIRSCKKWSGTSIQNDRLEWLNAPSTTVSFTYTVSNFVLTMHGVATGGYLAGSPFAATFVLTPPACTPGLPQAPVPVSGTFQI